MVSHGVWKEILLSVFVNSGRVRKFDTFRILRNL
jgi:hypothetical protein